MEIYYFAVYVFFPIALYIAVAGASYRIFRFVFLYSKGVYVRRPGGKVGAGLPETFGHAAQWSSKTMKREIAGGLVALHLALILVVLLLAQHIVYIEQYIPFFSVLWPLAIPLSPTTGTLTVTAPFTPTQVGMSDVFVNTIWGPLTVILNGEVLTIIGMLGVGYKIGEKIYLAVVERAKFARIGDLWIYGVLVFVIVTGLLAAFHLPSEDVATYRDVLGLHILSGELLLMTFPFTKYFHAVWGFWYGKLHEWYDLYIKRGTR